MIMVAGLCFALRNSDLELAIFMYRFLLVSS